MIFNAFHHDTSNNAFNHNTLRRNINNINNDVISNVNNLNNFMNNQEQSDNDENLDESVQVLNNNNVNLQLNTNNSQNNRNFENQIDEIYDSLTYLITTEKYIESVKFRNNLKNERLNLKRERTKFNEKKNTEILKLEKDKEIWVENLKIVESVNCKESDILDLDVGGTQKFSTTRSTLTKVFII
jgi:hypothetical protein